MRWKPRTLRRCRAASTDAADGPRRLPRERWRLYQTRREGSLIEARVAAAGDHARFRDGGPPPRADVEPVRDRLPAAEQVRFDDLLADARACYGVRDDNVALTFMWPSGLVRRALLEAGRRLVERDQLHDTSHVFALGHAEIAAALSGDANLGAVAEARTAHMEAAEADGAPVQLGDDEGPPPDPNLFPAAIASCSAPCLGSSSSTHSDPARRGREWTGEGAGVGAAAYTAALRRRSPEALDRLSQATCSSPPTPPGVRAIMPVAGAGYRPRGLESHAALVCASTASPQSRVTDATKHIPEGAT